MLENHQHAHTINRRVLTKVRSNFLRRRPKDEDDSLVPVPKFLNPNSSHMIDVSAGLLEKNRKILLGDSYLNSHLKIDEVIVEPCYDSRIVTLSIGKPESLISWEYSAKRLESYGDLDMAIWANRIRNFYVNYPKLMSSYYNMVESQDINANKDLQNTKLKINKLKTEIESKYPYKRVTYLYRQDKKELVSISFNEAILKEVGQSVEDFTIWTKDHGIPTLFDGGSKVAENLAKCYLDFPSSKIKEIELGNDVVNYLYEINGSKKKVTTQYIIVREPSPEGLLITMYVLIKSDLSCEDVPKNSCQNREGQEESSAKGYKCVKEIDFIQEEEESC